jgi:hypothetical protein
MDKVYYSQRDARWANVIYSARSPHTETIQSAGCGPTSAAMVVSSLTGKTVTPDKMAAYSVQNGFRIDGVGTDWGLFPAVAKTYGLACHTSYLMGSALECVKKGGLVVCSTNGGPKGLFSTGGHLFVLVGVSGNTLEFYDPDLYPGKYDMAFRKNRAHVSGNSVFVSKTDAEPEISVYFCFEKEEEEMTAEEKARFDGLSDSVNALAAKAEKALNLMIYNWSLGSPTRYPVAGFILGYQRGLSSPAETLRGGCSLG